MAIARSLIKEPEILLLDEPLSNLDARLRLEMREEIRRIQIETGVTTIFVTHDQEEAMSITDEIVLLKKGVIQQQCAPQEMYLNPKNRFVASFLGNPPIDFFHMPIRDGKLFLSEEYSISVKTEVQGEAYVGIRPEAWGVGKDLYVTAETVEQRGKDVLVGFHLAGVKTRAILNVTDKVSAGDQVGLTLKNNLLYLFDEESGMRIPAEVSL